MPFRPDPIAVQGGLRNARTCPESAPATGDAAASAVVPMTGQVRDAVSVIDESKIATHDEPAARGRSNYIIVRLDLGAEGLPGHYEQMWTRTDDKQQHELCCIPFFIYGLSLGDVITLTDADGAYRIESKGGHRTIRIAVQDQTYAHERHEGPAGWHRSVS